MSNKNTKKFMLTALFTVLLAALCLFATNLGMPFKSAKANVDVPGPASKWAFTQEDASGTAAFDRIGFMHMQVNMLNENATAWIEPTFVNDAEKGNVYNSRWYASSRWGDGTSPFCFDIQNSSLTLTLDVKLSTGMTHNAVLVSDAITDSANVNNITNSWSIWAKPDGAIEFTNFDGTNYSRYWNLGSIETGKWVNVAFVFDVDAKTIVTYVNGELKTTIYVPRDESIMADIRNATGMQAAYWTGVYFGLDGACRIGAMEAQMCNVNYYKSALSSTQIDLLNLGNKEKAPDPDALWGFHEFANGNNTVLDNIGYKHLDVKNSSWGGVNTVDDAVKGTVMESGCFANSRMGDGTSNWYFDIQNSSLTISMDVKLNANRGAYSVLLGDMITDPNNTLSTTQSWCIWVKFDGTVEFMTYDSNWGTYWNLGDIPANTWVNFTVVFDNHAKTIASYINGDKAGNIAVPEAMTLCATPVAATDKEGIYWTSAVLGRNGDGSQGNIDGTFCNVSYYDAALTEQQVAAINEENGSGIQPIVTDKTIIEFVGDSIVEGAGGTRPYSAIIEEYLGNEYLCLNYGLGGSCVTLDGSLPYVKSLRYRTSLVNDVKIVVIGIGVNDLAEANYSDIGNFENNFKNLVQSYLDLESDPTVYIMAPIMVCEENAGNYSNDKVVAEITPIERKVAEELGCVFVDTYAVTNGHPELYSDGLHPNDAGYEVIAKTLYKAITGEDYQEDSLNNELTTPIGAWDFTAYDAARLEDKSVKAIADRSGNGNPVIAQNSAKFVDDDKFGKVLEAETYSYNFDGQYDLNNGFTIALWVKANELKPYTRIISGLEYLMVDDRDAIASNWDIHVNGEGRVAFELANGAGWFPITGNNSTDTLETGKWVHIAVSYDAEKGKIYGFVNGVQTTGAATAIGTSFINTAHKGGLVIGTNAPSIVGYYNDMDTFRGKIANVRIYNVAYGADVVSGIMNGTDGTVETGYFPATAAAIPSANLTGAWNIDEGEGEFVNDISANRNHAILGTDVGWMNDFSGRYAMVIAPGYAVTAGTVDLSNNATITANIKINASHNGFGTIVAANAQARYHELGYLDKDFYIDSNSSRWNIHVNTAGKICVDCQGAWDLNLIEVPYYVVPESLSKECWINFAITVTKPETEDGVYEYRFYIDGYHVYTAERKRGISAPEEGDSTVIMANADAANNLQGNLTELRFYNKALTAEEVMLASRGDGLETPADRGLVLLKQFNATDAYKVGDTFTLNLSEYFGNEGWDNVNYTAYITDNTGEKVGKIDNGVFTMELKQAKENYSVTIAAQAGLQHVEFNVKLKISEVDSEKVSSVGCLGGLKGSFGLLAGITVLAAAISIKKKRVNK